MKLAAHRTSGRPSGACQAAPLSAARQRPVSLRRLVRWGARSEPRQVIALGVIAVLDGALFASDSMTAGVFVALVWVAVLIFTVNSVALSMSWKLGLIAQSRAKRWPPTCTTCGSKTCASATASQRR